MRVSRGLRLAALGLVLTGAACSSDHLVFTTYTKVGLDITLQDGAPTDAVLGYKRFEGALIPVDLEKAPEIHSIYAGLCVTNSWVQGLALGQVFATGTAAENVAGSAERSQEAQRFLGCRTEGQSDGE